MSPAAARMRRMRQRQARGLECWQIELPAGLGEELVQFVRPDIDIDDRKEVKRQLSKIIVDLYKKRYP